MSDGTIHINDRNLTYEDFKKLVYTELIPVAAVLVLLFRLACSLSSYVLGPLMWLFAGFDIYYLIQQNWIQVPLLTLPAVLCFLACCAEGVVQYLLESLRDGMISFIRSKTPPVRSSKQNIS